LEGGAEARAKGKQNTMQKILTIDGLKNDSTTIITAEKVYIGSQESEIIKRLRDFDLSNATPLMCYDFVRKLKEEL